MNREELLKAIEDKKKHIEKLNNDFKSCPDYMAGLIHDDIIFNTEILESYIKALELMEDKKVGRPSKGITKKVSLTLPDYLWDWVDEMVSDNEFGSRSSFLRRLVLDSYIEINRDSRK